MMACNGNMEAIPQTTNPTLLLGGTYDAWNRLVKLSEPPASAGGDPTTVAEYEYDGRNYRIVKKVYVDGVFDHDEHQYLSNSNQVLEVRHDGSTTAAMQYIWGERYIDDLILRDRTTTNPLDERLYCLQDANWNTVALVDDGGSVVQTFDYQPYGECTFLTSSYGASTNLYAWTTLFTGRELDLESGLYYFRARYLHAKVGTFLSRDPLGYVDGMSLIRAWFVPNGVDPEGRQQIAQQKLVYVPVCCTFNRHCTYCLYSKEENRPLSTGCAVPLNTARNKVDLMLAVQSCCSSKKPSNFTISARCSPWTSSGKVGSCEDASPCVEKMLKLFETVHQYHYGVPNIGAPPSAFPTSDRVKTVCQEYCDCAFAGNGVAWKACYEEAFCGPLMDNLEKTKR